MYHYSKLFSSPKVLSLILCLVFCSAAGNGQEMSKKRGMAYGYHSDADLAAISNSVSWWYNWSVQPESTVANVYQNYGMDFVPMTWNGSFNETALRAYYYSHPNARYLLGFNEPNFTTQSNMKPSQAAAVWPRLEKIAKDYNLKIASPAVNYSGNPVIENGVSFTDPVTWLDAFFAACPNCQVDYIAVHNYMCYSGALADYIKRFKKYNRPIWLTEFACWDQPTITLDMQKGYMMGAIDYLESDTCVFRYSWFNGNRSGAYPYLDLFKPQAGQLTDLGNLYVTFNPVHDPNLYFSIPARLEAENYSTMSGIAIEATKDISGTADVGWIDANDWLEYNIEVPAGTTDYNVFFRIAANAASSLELRENNVLLQTLNIPTTGGYQIWKTMQTTLKLTEGKHMLQVLTRKGQFNLNWLEITTESQPTSVLDIEKANVKVYPNPVVDKLVIETGSAVGKTQVTILNLEGRALFSQMMPEGNSRFEVDFSNYKSGSYIVQTKNADNTSSHLIIK
jgi:hypothetical protein